MISYMTSPQLKASAKARLEPVSSIALSGTAILLGFSLALNIPVLAIPSGTDFSWLDILSFVLKFVVSSAIGVLNAGYQYMFLKLYCGRPISADDVFFALRNRTKTAVKLSVIMSAISSLAMLPFTIFTARYAVSLDTMDLSIAFFCLTPALIFTTIIDLIYSQIYYLMLDFPDYTVKELFHRSRLLMRGHKGRLFYITVSFIPLCLFGFVTCGIGFLWIKPYMQAVTTEFYLDLVSKKQSS